MRLLLLLYIFFWGWFFEDTNQTYVSMPEICDNGIDDDGDGLIDLNDTVDCFCDGLADTVYRPSSLIPNPSFEDTLCCPTQLADLECANDWIQASWATSDFFHTCGYASDVARGRPPMPLPSGDAYVGFLDVSEVFGVGVYKEYVGACLTEPMEVGQEYTLQFYLGFGTAGRSYTSTSPVDIVLYGTTNCAELPFGGNLFAQCPSILTEWFEVGNVVLSGNNEWVQATIKFTANASIEAVAIGPSCAKSNTDNYYFLDELILNETEEFSAANIEMSGDVCDDTLTLIANRIVDLEYQWYKDGIAIAGAVDHRIVLTSGDEGTYIVRVSNGENCELSEPYLYQPAIYRNEIDTVICQGESIVLEGIRITDDFNREFSYPSSQYCDSIVSVNVAVRDTSVYSLDTSICISQSIEVGGIMHSIPGRYRIVVPNHKGCDSTIYLNLAVQDTVELAFDTTVCAGEVVRFNGELFSAPGSYNQFGKNNDGCDIRWNIRIRHHDTSLVVLDTSLCRGEPLISGGPVIEDDGRYEIEYVSSRGCDSTVVYRVEMRDTFYAVVDTTFCLGDGFAINGIQITGDTNLVVTNPGINFCDSSVLFRVRAYDYHVEQVDTVICEKDWLVFKGDTLRTAGEYTIIRKDPFGCDSSWEVTLETLPLSYTTIDTNLCADETFWFDGQPLTENTTGKYIFPSANGCDSIVELNLTFEPAQALALDIIQPISCYGMRDGEVNISGVNPDDRVIWNDGFEGTHRANLDTVDYQVSVISSSGCLTDFEFALTQPRPIKLDITGKDPQCQDVTSGEIFLRELSGGTGWLNVYLNGEPANPVAGIISGLGQGRFEIMVRDDNGCESSQSIELYEILPGNVQIVATADDILLGDTVMLSLSMEGVESVDMVDWYGPDTECLDCYDWRITPPKGRSKYEVFVTDEDGCQYEDQIFIETSSRFFVPNIFSPNGDDLNDFFTLFSDRTIKTIETFKIYDRWGELVHAASGALPGDREGAWDGSLDGQLLNPGVFIYYMEVIDNSGKTHVVTGEVTLIR